MPRNLITAGGALDAAVLDLHTELVACEQAAGSWASAYAVTLLDQFFQRVGLQSCDGCGSAAGEDCHPDCFRSPVAHDQSEGAPT